MNQHRSKLKTSYSAVIESKQIRSPESITNPYHGELKMNKNNSIMVFYNGIEQFWHRRPSNIFSVGVWILDLFCIDKLRQRLRINANDTARLCFQWYSRWEWTRQWHHNVRSIRRLIETFRLFIPGNFHVISHLTKKEK